jgi:Domain of unknown function (DUF1905)/Bacteriocin-protection, YdeI or OmpD-Associated
MIKFTAPILKFDKQGEKTGWTYIEILAEQANKLKPNNKKSFRVKGRLDNFSIKGIALLPMGEGDFIMPLNAAIRKGIGKKKGATLQVQLLVDDAPPPLSAELLACLEDEPKAKAFFNQLPKGEQNYFSKWIESAKTEPTKAKRIAQAINGFTRGLTFGPMIRDLKGKN